MTVRPIVLMLGAAALMQPPVADARILTIPECGGRTHRMIVPGDPADPDQRRDCAKVCHAIGEQRGKRSCNQGVHDFD